MLTLHGKDGTVMGNIDKAHDMLLKEVETYEQDVLHKLHNWMADNMSEEIAAGVIKGKTLVDAYKKITANARKLASDGSAMVDDKTVFGWLSDYYIKDNATFVPNASQKMPTGVKTTVAPESTPVKKKPKVKKSKKDVVQEIELQQTQLGFEFEDL